MLKPRDKQLLRPKTSMSLNKSRLQLARLPSLQRRCQIMLLLAVSNLPKLEPKKKSLPRPWKRKSNKWPKNSSRLLNSKLSNRGKILPLKTPRP